MKQMIFFLGGVTADTNVGSNYIALLFFSACLCDISLSSIVKNIVLNYFSC